MNAQTAVLMNADDAKWMMEAIILLREESEKEPYEGDALAAPELPIVDEQD